MAKRRLTKADIKFISLCPRGANRLPVIYKSEDKTVDFDTICKASEKFDDNGELTAIVYVPEFRDSEGDIASAVVIKEAMYEAARNGLNIDIRHNNVAVKKTDAFIAENFLIQKGDPRFDGMKDYSGKPVDVTGGWAVVVKIEDATLRKAYRSGEWNGISMGGNAAVEMEKTADTDAVLDRLAKLLNPRKDDFDMDKKELAELLAENNKALVEGVAKALKPEEKKVEVVEKAIEILTAPPIFKGDMSKAADVQAHQLAVKKFNLAKGVDFADDASVTTYLAELAKLDAKPEEKKVVEKSAREKELETELAEIRKQSNQPPPTEGTVVTTTTVTKDEDLFARGRAMAAMANKTRGLGTVK